MQQGDSTHEGENTEENSRGDEDHRRLDAPFNLRVTSRTELEAILCWDIDDRQEIGKQKRWNYLVTVEKVDNETGAELNVPKKYKVVGKQTLTIESLEPNLKYRFTVSVSDKKNEYKASHDSRVCVINGAFGFVFCYFISFLFCCLISF